MYFPQLPEGGKKSQAKHFHGGEKMALTMYVGGAGAGKTHALMTHIIKESIDHPKTQYLVIVPEQATMEMQKRLVLMHPQRAIMNIDVLSFNRLAYRVFEETGVKNEDLLEEIGKTFLLEKIALEEKKHLHYFGGTLARPGNLAEMKSLLSELMLYEISPETLESLLIGSNSAGTSSDSVTADYPNSGALNSDDSSDESHPSNASLKESPYVLPHALSEKLSDIVTVYRAFQKKTDGKFLVREEVPDRLCEIADESEMLKDSVIALDGFTGFTPVQLRLIEKLLPIVQDISVTVTMDPNAMAQAANHDMDLFHFSAQTVTALTELARKTGVQINPPVKLERTEMSRGYGSRNLTFLSEHIFRRKREISPQPCRDIHIASCANPREEIEEAALFIARKVRTGGFRWRDFAVVTGDLTTYDNYVQQVFGEWQIPCFIDEKRALLMNPFMEYIRAAIESCVSGYSYEGIFRMLRTGMTDFTRDEIDHLENYVLGLGIRSKKKWREKFIRSYYKEDAGEVPLLDNVRERLCALLDPLADVLAARNSTVYEKTSALYEFCLRTNAEEKLQKKAEMFETLGDNARAREYTQVYPYVIGFLDKLVDVLGDERISMKDYQALLEAGFAEARVAVIPPGADQVLVGDMERSRIGEVRFLLFVGVNEGLIPRTPPEGGILSESDRASLLSHKVKMRPQRYEAMAIERFYLYLTLTKPSSMLWISMSRSSASGEAIHPAYLISLIRNLFPDLVIEEPAQEITDRVERKSTGIHLLTREMELLGEKQPDPAFCELFSYYAHDPEYAARTNNLLSAAGKRKPLDIIGKKTAEALYGRQMTGSATRLETFCQCAMRQFLNFGLKLKDRPEYTFSQLDLGNVIHKALEDFGNATQKGPSWSDMSEDNAKRNAYADRCMQKALEESGFTVLKETARDAYQINRMTRLFKTAVWAQAKQLAAGDFSPSAFEMTFSEKDRMGSTLLDLGDGRSMLLTGKIDRLDTTRDGDMTYFKIIDYKTGAKKFDLDEVYYGLQMQLVLYLNAVIDLYKKKGVPACPAGVFYYRVQDPVVDFVPGETNEELLRRILKELKVSGVVMKEKTAAGHLDHALKTDGEVSSDVVPCAYTKKGDFGKNGTSALEPEAFLTMEHYVSRMARTAAKRILDGKADTNPYAFSDQDTACSFCPYKGTCGFDIRIPGSTYRRLIKKKKADEIIKAMEDADGVDSGSEKGH